MDEWEYVLRRLARDNFYAFTVWTLLWGEERLARARYHLAKARVAKERLGR